MHYYYPGYMMGYGGDFGIFHVVGGVLTFLFWLVIVVLVIRLIKRRGMFHDRRHIWMHSSALDILKERYAKGEIDKTEFESKKKDLE